MKKYCKKTDVKRKSFQRMRCQDSELGSQRAVKGKTFHKTEMSGGRDVKKVDTNKSFGNEVVTLGSCRLPLFY